MPAFLLLDIPSFNVCWRLVYQPLMGKQYAHLIYTYSDKRLVLQNTTKLLFSLHLMHIWYVSVPIKCMHGSYLIWKVLTADVSPKLWINPFKCHPYFFKHYLYSNERFVISGAWFLFFPLWGGHCSLNTAKQLLCHGRVRLLLSPLASHANTSQHGFLPTVSKLAF